MTRRLVIVSELEQFSKSGDVILGYRLCRHMQKLLEAAMDVIGCREVCEFLIQSFQAGPVELQWIGCGQAAFKDIVILHRAALGKEDGYFFD